MVCRDFWSCLIYRELYPKSQKAPLAVMPSKGSVAHSLYLSHAVHTKSHTPLLVCQAKSQLLPVTNLCHVKVNSTMNLLFLRVNKNEGLQLICDLASHRLQKARVLCHHQRRRRFVPSPVTLGPWRRSGSQSLPEEGLHF